MEYELRHCAARFLAAVFGPLGPHEGMRAYWRGIELAERGMRERGWSPGAFSDALYGEAMREDAPDYLRGLSRAQLQMRVDDYALSHAEEVKV